MTNKIFSIGISPNWDITIIKNFLLKYQNYIHSIFFGLPLLPTEDIANDFTLRPVICSDINVINTLKDIGDFAKNLNIRVDLIANHFPDPKENPRYIKLFEAIETIQPSEMTVLPEMAEYLHNKYSKIPFVYSFNSAQPKETDYQNPLFYSYVLGRHYFWQPDTWPDKDTEIRFLIDSCCPECGGCGNPYWNRNCKKIFEKEYIQHDMEYYIAYHMAYPRDIKLYLENFPENKFVFKTASRNRKSIDTVIRYLDFYISNESNYNCVDRLTEYGYEHFMTYRPGINKNNDLILKYKQEFWEKLVPGVIY